jgi:hypothetical protein
MKDELHALAIVAPVLVTEHPEMAGHRAHLDDMAENRIGTLVAQPMAIHSTD